MTFTAVHGLWDWRVGPEASFPFLSRVLELPPLVAQAAFDAVRVAHQQRGGERGWGVWVPSGHLVLAGPGWVSPPPRACYWSYRIVPGTIRGLGWPRTGAVAIRLELLPWSATRTALGLGVARLPLLASDEVYGGVASAALDLLRDEMHGWALQELLDVERSLDIIR